MPKSRSHKLAGVVPGLSCLSPVQTMPTRDLDIDEDPDGADRTLEVDVRRNADDLVF
jgi:hypothetical protein